MDNTIIQEASASENMNGDTIDATPECADNQMFCWMRCMDFTETVSPEACAEQDGLRVQCASQRDQIWRHEDSHGDYRPTCTNSTQHVTPTPTIPIPHKT